MVDKSKTESASEKNVSPSAGSKPPSIGPATVVFGSLENTHPSFVFDPNVHISNLNFVSPSSNPVIFTSLQDPTLQTGANQLIFPAPQTVLASRAGSSFFIDSPVFEQYKTLEREIALLRERQGLQALALSKSELERRGKEKEIKELQKTTSELETKERLGYILNRVRPEAHAHLFNSPEFQKKFLETRTCQAFVMSVDIRRSTELMLKARSPQQFSEFITALCNDLMGIILGADGVFDKFTGDGVLAFFPEFYSGVDSAFRVISAADKCHESFRRHYGACRKSFKSILTDVGLGIGVDYGSVHLMKIAGGLTVVGEPVVYACRLSAAPANQTYLNQPAYEQVSESCGANCTMIESSIDIKHEGNMLAYGVHLNERPYEPKPPAWLQQHSISE